MSKPAHKQDDPAKAPGQVVNDIPAYSYKPSHGGRPDVTLGDYLARKNYHDAFDKVAEEKGLKKKKLTFDEWYTLHWKECPTGTFDYFDTFKFIWKAAQENV